MATLTQVIRALQYGPLFDMMDRRTGTALLLVNKEISEMIVEYVNAPTREGLPSFAHPAFDLRTNDWPALYLRIRGEVIYIDIGYNPFIKCTWTSKISKCNLDNLETTFYVFNIHDHTGEEIIDSIILSDKFSWNELITSYQDYIKRRECHTST